MSPTPRSGGNSPPKRGAIAARSALGGEQVEGRRAVRELLAVGRRRTHDVWLSESVDVDDDIVAEIVALAGAARVPVRRVARSRLDGAALTSAPQGVLAHADPLPEAVVDDFLRGSSTAKPFLIALDGVTDPQNLGALLRVADGAGVTGVVLPRHRAVHVTPAVAKAAAGAIEHVPIAVVGSVAGTLHDLTRKGVWTVGLDGDAPSSIFEMELATEPLVLVLGAEGRGLSRLAHQRCEAVVAIPQFGGLPSLNVAAAGAVACYEVARRRAGQTAEQ